MKKRLLIGLSILGLTACGGGKSADGGSQAIKDEKKDLSTLYSFDIDPYYPIYLQPKIYTVNNRQEFLLKYGEIQIPEEPAKLEAFRGYLTEDRISSIFPPSNADQTYFIGEGVRWDGRFLEYKPSNYLLEKQITLKYEFINKDISGQGIGNYFINQFRKSFGVESGTTKIIWALLGIEGSSMGVFPKGSECWQKKSAQSTQKYIEFYPENKIPHVNVSSDTQIKSIGYWGNVKWTQYVVEATPSEANVKVEYDDKTMWGFYHEKNEDFLYAQNEVICEFLNQTAYQAVQKSMDKMLFEPDDTQK